MNLSVVCLIILVCVQSRSSSSILFTSVTLGNASPTLTVPETEDNNNNYLGKLFNVAMSINYNIVHTVGAGIGGAIGGALIIFILAFILSVLIMRRQSEFF